VTSKSEVWQGALFATFSVGQMVPVTLLQRSGAHELALTVAYAAAFGAGITAVRWGLPQIAGFALRKIFMGFIIFGMAAMASFGASFLIWDLMVR
jgi:hypothetical protein